MPTTPRGAVCGAPKPGDGHPCTGIPRCTKDPDHTASNDRTARMHGGRWGECGWVAWGADFRPAPTGAAQPAAEGSAT